MLKQIFDLCGTWTMFYAENRNVKKIKEAIATTADAAAADANAGDVRKRHITGCQKCLGMAVQFPEDLIGIASLSGCKLVLVNEFQVTVFDLTDTDRTFRPI